MAGGNWDTFIAGNVSNLDKNGVSVDVHKSYLIVGDSKGWSSGGGFCEPYVLQIKEGELNYKGISIYAVAAGREGICPESIYFLAWEVSPGPDGKYDYSKKNFIYGIGTYGYQGEAWYGVREWQIDQLYEWVHGHDSIPPDIKTAIPKPKLMDK